jgi:hypothetical protein
MGVARLGSPQTDLLNGRRNQYNACRDDQAAPVESGNHRAARRRDGATFS